MREGIGPKGRPALRQEHAKTNSEKEGATQAKEKRERRKKRRLFFVLQKKPKRAALSNGSRMREREGRGGERGEAVAQDKVASVVVGGNVPETRHKEVRKTPVL